MFHYRVTKYDPTYRDQTGHYTRDDWVMFSQVGRECGGTVLTLDEYERVESSYIDSALGFMREAGIRSMSAYGVENAKASPTVPTEGARIDLSALPKVMRRLLREEFWCRLEAPDAFIHFGWDYNMYLGVPVPCDSACKRARSHGLFVEPFESPYFDGASPDERAS